MGSLLLPTLLKDVKKELNAGVQLYSVREDMLANATGTLKALAKIGIRQIESAASTKGYYYGLSPKEMKTICSDLGMTLRSGHVPLNDKWPEILDQAAESGQEYLICSSFAFADQTPDTYKKVAERFNKAGEEAMKRGIKFGYHNHDFEFEKYNGVPLYNLLLEHSDPKLVHMELDLAWVLGSGFSPLDYFEKYPGRFPLWHLKDLNIAEKRSTEFGKGSLPIKNILDHANASGLKYYFIEQEEYSMQPLDAIQYNLKYLQAL